MSGSIEISLDDLSYDIKDIFKKSLEEKANNLKEDMEKHCLKYIKNLDYSIVASRTRGLLESYITSQVGNELRVYMTDAEQNRAAFNKLFKDIFDEELKKQFRSEISKFIREEIQKSIKEIIQEKLTSL